MTISNYLSFFFLVLTIVYSPGPMTMFMLANGMKMQYNKIWPVLIGANSAYLVSILLFTQGATKILQQNKTVFKSVQILGVIYILCLAYIQWNKKSTHRIAHTTSETSRSSTLYMRGALIAFTNPKTIILFSLIFPQFINEKTDQIVQVAILGVTFLALQFSSGCVYAYFGRSLKHFLEKSTYQILMNKLTAIILGIVAGFLFLKLY